LILVFPFDVNAFSLGLSSGPNELYLQKGSSYDFFMNLSPSADSLVELSTYNGPFDVSVDSSPVLMEKGTSKLVFARISVPESTEEGLYKVSFIASFKSPSANQEIASRQLDLMINVLPATNNIYYTAEGINAGPNISVLGLKDSDLILERASKGIAEVIIVNESGPVSPADLIVLVHDVPENVKVNSTELTGLKAGSQGSIFIEVSTDESTDFNHFVLPVYVVEKGTSNQWLAGSISLTVIPNYDLIVKPENTFIDFNGASEKTFSLTLRNPSRVPESFKTVISSTAVRLESPADENILLNPLEEKTINFIASQPSQAQDINAARISFIGSVSRHASVIFANEKNKGLFYGGISGLISLGPGSILFGIIIIAVLAFLYLKKKPSQKTAVAPAKESVKKIPVKMPFFGTPGYILKMKQEGTL
jgi:hypothetical protein